MSLFVSLFAILKLSLYLLTTLIIVPLQLVYSYLTGDFIRVAILYHKACLFIFGIKVRIHGTLPLSEQTIILSNHLSYLDITVLGSFASAVFVSKDDVAKWPLFGFLASLQKTVFISRSRAGLEKAKNDIQERLQQNQNLILFPEGTSTRGISVYPFKSSLLSVLEKASPPPLIQPIAIKHNKLNGRPVKTNQDRDAYAWHIDDDLEIHQHLWIMAKQRSFVIDVYILDPIEGAKISDRKVLAKLAEEKIRNSVEAHQTS